jgi:tRNA dimethylallyltransferase
MKKGKVIVLLGPTATGKTSLSIELAQKYNGEIVSADSRQIYKGLDLGTGKVTKKEMQRIPHHLLDVASPKKVFAVSDYIKLATKAIDDILARSKIPIIVGGTGFYIDALVTGVVLPEVPPNKALREKLQKLSAEKLFHKLEKMDSERAKTIDKQNSVRLVRAIEIVTALGSVPKLKPAPKYEVLKIGLDMNDDTLKARTAIRLTERLKQGMLKEASELHQKGLSYVRMRNLGLEYRHMADHLTKKTSHAEFETTLAADIWQYVKRQRTWFKRDTQIVWLDPTKKSTLGKASALVKKFLH